MSGKEFGSDEYKAAEDLLPVGVKVMEEVYAKTNEVYVQYELLNLPWIYKLKRSQNEIIMS